MKSYPMWKRLIDIGGAIVIISVTAPLWLLACVAVWVEDGGNPLFLQQRVGEDLKIITIRKIRTMTVGAPNVPSAVAPPSVTRVGKLLRRLNLDEIPQLISVLSGAMALVGPRPCLPDQEDLIRLRVANGASRCRPGLTGWAQIRSYEGMSVEEKASLDGVYASSLCPKLDLKIIAMTPAYFLEAPPKY
jgi:O-antigen biosynthesis protein WbqP